MASKNKSPHLNLNQWVESDKPERADFNGDNQKRDDAFRTHSETQTSALNTIRTAVNGKEETCKTANFTLYTTGWQGTAEPYKQTVNVTGVTAISTIGGIDLVPNATADQAWARAQVLLLVASKEAGKLTIHAIGGKPSVNLPMNCYYT